MSKFLLNLLLQISKALVNLKIQFLIQKSFFLAFGPFGIWPSQPTGHAVPIGRNSPGRPIQPARRSRLRGKCGFPFASRLPLPAASPSSLCQPGPTCQIHPLPRAGLPRSEIPRAAASLCRCPAPRMPLSFNSPPSSLSPLIPFKPSLNAFNGVKAINASD
jgi:hypothetical protein